MPLRPCRRAVATSSSVLPMQETMPRPVITTRLDMLRYYLVQTINQREDQMAQLRSAIVLIAGVLGSNAVVARDLPPLVDQNVAVVTGSCKPASPAAFGVAIAERAER